MNLGQCVADQLGRRDDAAEVVAFRWVEVEHEMGGGIGIGNPEQSGMKFDGALIGKPQ